MGLFQKLDVSAARVNAIAGELRNRLDPPPAARDLAAMDGVESSADWTVVGGGFRKGPYDTAMLARMLRTGRIRAPGGRAKWACP